MKVSNSMTVKELRAIAKELGFKGFSKKVKSELIEDINAEYERRSRKDDRVDGKDLNDLQTERAMIVKHGKRLVQLLEYGRKKNINPERFYIDRKGKVRTYAELLSLLTHLRSEYKRLTSRIEKI